MLGETPAGLYDLLAFCCAAAWQYHVMRNSPTAESRTAPKNDVLYDRPVHLQVADEIICDLRSHWDLHVHLCIIWDERSGEPTARDFILFTGKGSLELLSEDITELRDTIVEGKLPNDDAATRAENLNRGGYQWAVENAARQERVFLDAVNTMLRAIDDGYYVYYTSSSW